MQRCFTLAQRGISTVKSNPMVGSVVVSNNQIIAEGYHQKYGDYHAERNALLNCTDKSLLHGSTMYVSLEPCNHHGKTPPCTDIIIDSGISKVYVAQLDPNPVMQGMSISVLEKAGIETHVGLLNKEARHLNRRFIINQQEGLPYIMLKFAKSYDGFMGVREKQVWLSNPESKVAVHKLRSEYQAILVGTNTAITDNPELTTRVYPGQSPLRVVIDRHQRIPLSHKLRADNLETWIYTYKSEYATINDKKRVILIPLGLEHEMEWIMKDLYKKSITNIIIEGGRSILNTMIKNDLWHEAMIIETPIRLGEGIKSPTITGVKYQHHQIGSNKILKIKSLRLNQILNKAMVKVPLIKVNS